MTTPKLREPQRIRRRRVKGWRMPPNTVCVTRPGKWGNPFTVRPVTLGYGVFDAYGCVDTFRTKSEAATCAVNLFREALNHSELSFGVEDVRRELRGKNLACYCPSSPCHADVLLEIANA